MDHPAEISNDRADRVLTIVWQDGTRQRWPHAQLRASCKCAQCQSQRLSGSPASITEAPRQQPRVDRMNMVGNYGLQLVFNDGHQRGIYPWSYLRALGPVSITLIRNPNGSSSGAPAAGGEIAAIAGSSAVAGVSAPHSATET